MMIVVCSAQPVNAEDGSKASKDANGAVPVEECACSSSEEVNSKLGEYVAAARARIDAKDVDTLNRFDKAVLSFKQYGAQMCRAIYSKLLKEEKRIRTFYCCQERLAQQHAMELWLDFIRQPDANKILLARPKLQKCQDE